MPIMLSDSNTGWYWYAYAENAMKKNHIEEIIAFIIKNYYIYKRLNCKKGFLVLCEFLEWIMVKER